MTYSMPERWLDVAGCYTGPQENYDAFLASSCAAQYSTCPCVNQSMPRATTQVLPTMTPTQREAAILPAQGALSPVDLVRPLPTIVTQEPIDMTPPCSGFTDWVAQNQGLAIGLLAVTALLVFGGKR